MGGGGGGIYYAQFTEAALWYGSQKVDDDFAAGAHLHAELEYALPEGAAVSLLARAVLLEFRESPFRLPSGVTAENDFSGWQLFLGYSRSF